MERLCRDGVALSYQEAGIGDPPILLVHGLDRTQAGHRPLGIFEEEHCHGAATSRDSPFPEAVGHRGHRPSIG